MGKPRKLSGGAKHKYLREHRREILGYLTMHGEYKTLEKYGMKVETLERLLRDNGVERRGNLYEIEVTNIKIEMIKERCKVLEKRMNTWEDNFNVPVEELADNIRNSVVVPLLRMVQKPQGFEFERNEKLFEIGSIIGDGREK
ncbi:hypothetical protein ACFLUD_01725 [Chloroflexota bacterium]